MVLDKDTIVLTLAKLEFKEGTVTEVVVFPDGSTLVGNTLYPPVKDPRQRDITAQKQATPEDGWHGYSPR